MARFPAIQDRLRTEVREARSKARQEGREELGSDELNSLEYLDAVCVRLIALSLLSTPRKLTLGRHQPNSTCTAQREILRLESPVSATIRTSAIDDLIPLSHPVASPAGGTISAVPVKKGQTIMISVNAVNKNKAVFGEDAHEFRPERWLDGNLIQGNVGVYSHLLTFLAG